MAQVHRHGVAPTQAAPDRAQRWDLGDPGGMGVTSSGIGTSRLSRHDARVCVARDDEPVPQPMDRLEPRLGDAAVFVRVFLPRPLSVHFVGPQATL